MNPDARSSLVAVARIIRTRGKRGEVLAELHTDFPARFSLLDRVWVQFPDGQRKRLKIESCREHKGRQVMKFEAIDSISDAETLTGAWIKVEPAHAVPLPEGTYWDHELVGCSLRDARGAFLGVVIDVMRIEGNSQLVVQGESGEYLVPAVATICREISLERREIVVELPEGLMDLNK